MENTRLVLPLSVVISAKFGFISLVEEEEEDEEEEENGGEKRCILMASLSFPCVYCLGNHRIPKCAPSISFRICLNVVFLQSGPIPIRIAPMHNEEHRKNIVCLRTNSV
jgi:hypothetical protein